MSETTDGSNKQGESSFSGQEIAKDIAESGREVIESTRQVEAQNALNDVLEAYIEESWSKNRYVLPKGMDREAGHDRLRDHMQKQYDRLQDLEPDSGERAAMTICIPVAIEKEDPAAVAKAVGLLQQSVASDDNYEVVLWANAKDTGDKDKIDSNYQALLSTLRDTEHPNLQIKSTLKLLPEGSAGKMGTIRADYMDAVAIDCQKRGYGYDHPVLWLDADTTSVSKGALEDIAAAVRSFDAAFVHADLRFSADWATGKKISELDDATKAVAVDEIHRRQGARERPEFNDKTQYHEESGLAFSIGVYLKDGGLERSLSGSESDSLMATHHWGKKLPAYLGKDMEPRDMPEIQYLKSARIGTSARRQHELVNRLGPSELSFPTQDYELFTDVEGDGKERTITREVAIDMVAKTEAKEQKSKEDEDEFQKNRFVKSNPWDGRAEVREKYKGRMDKTVNRFFPEKEAEQEDNAA